MKIKDIRTGKTTEIGDAQEITGDSSLLFMNTDKGYRLIMDAYNMKKIADYYNSIQNKEVKNGK